MRRHGIRLFLTFLAGGLVALLVGGVAGSLAATRYADLALFTSVLDLVRQHYFAPIDDGRLLHGAVRGLIQQLDPTPLFSKRMPSRRLGSTPGASSMGWESRSPSAATA
jgi:carboxyl-terminal processing protease